MKDVVNTDRESLHIFWMTRGIPIKFSQKMWLLPLVLLGLRNPYYNYGFGLVVLRKLIFLLQFQGAENWGFLISTESKLFYNTETNMHLSTIFTEWKKSYFVEQPFLADYLFWQKIISCISSFCGDF